MVVSTVIPEWPDAEYKGNIHGFRRLFDCPVFEYQQHLCLQLSIPIISRRSDYFERWNFSLETFLTIVLVGDWNVVFDEHSDRVELGGSDKR